MRLAGLLMVCALSFAQVARPDEAQPSRSTPQTAAPQDSDALVRAGFTALRQQKLAEAQVFFQRAAATAPRYSDAHFGLALCAERQGRIAEAKTHLQRALAIDPARQEFLETRARLLAQAPEIPAIQRSKSLVLDFRVSRGQGFEVRSGSQWKSIFLKGINLGAALPGKYPSEFPDKATYQSWIKDMAELGVNCVRVYTIHPPAFYEALREHNLKAASPIYLVHGVWVEPPPHDEFTAPAWFDPWKEEMRRVVDLLHGRAWLKERPGHASGVYLADVSSWTLAYILGREWEPFNAVNFNKHHPGLADWKGRFVGVRQGHATEVFMAQALEALLSYEHDTYHTQRPTAFTNWPTLDPLFHPMEATKAEEVVLRKKLNQPLEPGEVVKEYDNDAVGLDMEKYSSGALFEAGFFASYHAYPYYPDFINLDANYVKGADHLGPNNYLAYLRDLVRHHTRHAVVISEFGVPSSRLVAHWQHQGMTHGGQNEREQGEQDARLFRNIYDSGCAGGILFAWIDEWFKKNWLVIDFEEPRDRKPFWYNAQDAEENYGMLGVRPGKDGPSILIDGKSEDWKNVPAYIRGQELTLKLKADEGWLHLGIFFPGGKPDWSKEGFLVGLDTYDAKLGDHTLPFGLGLKSEAGLEFVVRFQGDETAVLADAPYDLFTHRYARPYRSVDNEAGTFVMPRTESNRSRIGRDGQFYPHRRQEIGWLRRGTQDRRDSAFHSKSEWMEGPGFIEARIPWGLLNVTDPSSRRVVHDPRSPGESVGVRVTEGFRALLVRYGPGAVPAAAIPAPANQGSIPLPPLFTWPTWQQPSFHVFRKQSFEKVKEALRTLPDAPVVHASALVLSQKDLNILLDRARTARDQGRMADAVQAYDAILAQMPAHETALLERAQTLSWMGRYSEALAEYQAFKERFPEQALEADLRIAQVRAWSDDIPTALEVLAPWVREGRAQAVLDDATYRAWQGHLGESLDRLDAWLKVHPEDRAALMAKARFRSWTGQLSVARKDYEAVLAKYPEDGEARLGLARLALWLDDPVEARAQLERTNQQTRRSPDGQMLEAQCEAAEGKGRASTEILKRLAKGGSAQRDARDALMDQVSANGPWVELRYNRTDTNEGLSSELPALRARVPFLEGYAQLELGRSRLQLQDQERHFNLVGASLRQILGSRWRVSAGFQLNTDFGGRADAAWSAGAGVRLAPGLQLQLDAARTLLDYTPAAVDRRGSIITVDLGLSWAFGNGLNTVNLGAGRGNLSAGSHRNSLFASYERRIPLSWVEFRGGAVGRFFEYSETLPLGFFNPERFRYFGLTTAATVRPASHLQLTPKFQAGTQRVNSDPSQFAWGYGISGEWLLLDSRLVLFGSWNYSKAGLPVTQSTDPEAYSEHTLLFGFRWCGKTY